MKQKLHLSNAELQILHELATENGPSDKMIAHKLHRSPATISKQINGAMKKTGTPSRTGLAVHFLKIKHGILL